MKAIRSRGSIAHSLKELSGAYAAYRSQNAHQTRRANRLSTIENRSGSQVIVAGV
jgi:hypothetical protein